jgi:dolichyldiphosphatase
MVGPQATHSTWPFLLCIPLVCKGLGISNKQSRFITASLPWPFTVLTMYSRVYFWYDTMAQVYSGGILGLFLGSLWFWFVNSALIHTFPMLESTPMYEYLCIKDMSHIPNVLHFEYQNARAARKATMDAKHGKQE